MGDLVLRAPWVVPVDGDPVRDGEVAVRDGAVLAVGRDLGSAGSGVDLDQPTYVDHDGVVAPGLVNAHAHLVYGPAYQDLATSGLPFDEWITYLLPRRQAMTGEQHAEQAELSARLVVQSGTTAVADVASHADTVPVLERSGLRGRAYWELAGADADVWARRRDEWSAVLDAHPTAGISPHTLYTLGDAVVADLAVLARSRGRRLHPHLAETTSEAEFVLSGSGAYVDFGRRFGLAFELADGGSGRTPVEHLEHLGGLGPDVHVAHGVHVSAGDRDLLRRKGSAVALCTRSNRVLRAGQAPVRAYREEGNPVAVGTDSLASSPSLDLLEELRALEQLALDQGTEPVGLQEWLVRAATTGGARALGIEAGTLGPGARADVVVVESDQTADPWSAVVHGRATATYLAGVLQ